MEKLKPDSLDVVDDIEAVGGEKDENRRRRKAGEVLEPESLPILDIEDGDQDQHGAEKNGGVLR